MPRSAHIHPCCAEVHNQESCDGDHKIGPLGLYALRCDVRVVLGSRIRRASFSACGTLDATWLTRLPWSSGYWSSCSTVDRTRAHLRQRRVRENACLLQRGSKIVEASQEVLQLLQQHIANRISSVPTTREPRNTAKESKRVRESCHALQILQTQGFVHQ